jgi:hypothetical protein
LLSVSKIAIVLSAIIVLTFPQVLSTAVAASATSYSTVPTDEGNSFPTSGEPVFAWMFGYVGNSFYPQTQLNLTQQDFIGVAKNMSLEVGFQHLQLVTVVSQIPSHTINSTMIPIIRNFVESLRQYASVVYGRIDLFQFNLTTKLTIYNESQMYANELDLNGIWLDHASQYYSKVGEQQFNLLMQNLTTMLPNEHFILNHTFHRVLITPMNGTTWESMTYVSPSTKSDLTINRTLLADLNQLFPNHVLMHFDAFATEAYEPMGKFADLNASTEISLLSSLASKGAFASRNSYRYLMLYPIIGGWTYVGSQYHGTLYNSLSFGNYSRSTFQNFTNIMVATDHPRSVDPIFVWLYGYVGDYFYPETNLSLTPQELIDVAANLSYAVGSTNLRLVSPVDEEPGHNIQPQMIATIKSYVDSLKPYSSIIYGRLDLLEFNTTTKISLYSQVSMYVNQLDLNGIWFDHGPYLWASMGPTAFNSMMQNLTNNFPNLHFIMNEAANTKNYITPLPGTTWGNMTYISPTVVAGTYDKIPFTTIAALNNIWEGRVLLHLDAFAISKTAPMGVFANQTSEVESQAVRYMAHTGEFPSSKNYSFSFMFPVIGSWTYDGSIYHGTLYNSLGTGVFARYTIANFTNTMIKVSRDP